MTLLSIRDDSLAIINTHTPFFRSQVIEKNIVHVSPDQNERFDIDIWALKLKKLLSEIKYKKGKISLILSQRFWNFLRIEIPLDADKEKIPDFIKRQIYKKFPETHINDKYINSIFKNRGRKFANIFILTQEKQQEINTLLRFFDLNAEAYYPEVMFIYSSFQHTLNKNKEERVLFLDSNEQICTGYYFDSNGLIEGSVVRTPTKQLIEKLKQISSTDKKPTRLILSGVLSKKIRQDSFTKEVGIWTNPLHRILGSTDIIDTAQKYELEKNMLLFVPELFFLKALDSNTNYKYALLPKNIKNKKLVKIPSFSLLKNKKLKKILTITGIALLTSLLTYVLISSFNSFKISPKLPNINFNLVNSAPTSTPTPLPTQASTPTPTPAPAIKRSTIAVSVENGVGIPGLASKYKKRLNNIGYATGNIGNADNYEYKKTIIKTGDKKIFNMLSEDLKEFIKGMPDFEKTSSTTSAVIILGADSN